MKHLQNLVKSLPYKSPFGGLKGLFFFILLGISNSAFTQVELISTGSANNYLLTFPGVFSYSNGISFTFKANFANTAGATINVNGLGQKTILKHKDSPLVGDDIKSGQVVTLVYDGTNFQMTSGLGNAPGGGGGGGTLAGDVTGAIGTNTVEKIRGVNVVATPPTTNQVLQYNGTNWVPSTLGGGGGNPAWELGGNIGTDSTLNYIGTDDEQPLVFKTFDVERLKLRLDGGLTFFNSNNNLMLGSGLSVSGIANTVVGINAEAGSGNLNTSLGVGAMNRFTSGNSNLALGVGALGGDADPGYPQPNGYNNIALGFNALQFNDAGDGNIGMGGSALNTNTGDGNIGVGSSVLYSNTGDGNIGLGDGVLGNNSGNRNIGIGYYVMHANLSGSNNIGMGEDVLRYNTSGYSNIALGKWALKLNNNGDNNVAVGEMALNENTSGRINTAIGGSSLKISSTGSRNVAVGTSALSINMSGNENVAVGVNAMGRNNFGSNNTAIGDSANVATNNLNYATAIGANAVVAQSNSLVLGDTANIKVGIGTGEPSASLHIDGTFRLQGNGAASGRVLTSDGNGNATWQPAGGGGGGNPSWELLGNSGTDSAANFIGTTDAKPVLFRTNNINRLKIRRDGAVEQYMANFSKVFGSANSLGSLTTGLENAAFGDSVMISNTSGSYNSAFGFAALRVNTSGSNNTAIGDYALVRNTTGNSNSAVGSVALQRNTTGFQNSAFGVSSLGGNTTGQENTAMGHNSLNNNVSGSQNTAIGAWTMTAVNTSSFTTAVGYGALTQNTSGNNNTAIGGNAMFVNSTGAGNTAVGRQSLTASTTGATNTAVGYLSLGANTTGSSNTALGSQALATNTTGTKNTAIGASANVGSNALTNATAIGANARVDGSNCIVLGSINGVNGATASAKVGIGTTSPPTSLFILTSGGAGTGFALVDGSQGTNKVLTSDNNGYASWQLPQTVGNLAGDVTGPIGSNTVMRINGVGVDGTTPTTNQVLKFNGTDWAPATLNGVGLNPAWELSGNSGTDSAANFIGTTDEQPLIFKTFGNEKMKLTLDGALELTPAGSQSIMIGRGVPASQSMARVVVIGDNALRSVSLNDDSYEHTVIGYGAMYSFQGSSRYGNTVVGANGAYDLEYGSYNTVIGHYAMTQTQDATGNVAIGEGALSSNNGGEYNSAIGYGATVGTTALTNATAIGANAVVSQSNSLVLGDTANIKVGIRTGFPQQALHVNGQVRIDTVTSATAADSILTISSGGVIRKRTAASLAPTGWNDYAIYEERYPNNTGASGSTYISGNWNSCVLNSTQSSNGSAISRTGGQFTLTPGTYYISANGNISFGATTSVSGYADYNVRIWNASTSTTALLGGTSEQYITNGTKGHFKASVEGVITVSTTQNFNLDHFIYLQTGTLSIGTSSSDPSEEIFAHLFIQKIQ